MTAKLSFRFGPGGFTVRLTNSRGEQAQTKLDQQQAARVLKDALKGRAVSLEGGEARG